MAALDRSVGADGIGAYVLHGEPVNLIGAGVKVGVLDDKIAAHPNLTIGGNGGTGPAQAHATECAGVINSNHATYKGVAPGTSVYGYAVNEWLDTFKGANWLVGRGIKIIAYPFGWELGGDVLDGSSWETRHLDYLAYHDDVLFAVSGNQSGGGAPLPTDNFNGLTVNATVMTATGKYDRLAGWNYYGEAPVDGRCKPDIVAPGGYEGYPERHPESIYTTALNNGWANVSGTSFAAPMVAGVAALLRQHGTARSISTNHNVLKAVLLNSANKATLDQSGRSWLQSEAYFDHDVPLDDQLGAGQLDAAGAYLQYSAGEFGPGLVPLVGWDLGTIVGEGAVLQYQLRETLKAGTFLTATLVWDRRVILENDQDHDGQFDYEHTDVLTAFPLNDLDLNLYGAGGTLVTNSVSPVDNVEHIFWKIPSDGLYCLSVEFRQMRDLSAQPYALAWSAVHELGQWFGQLGNHWEDANNWSGRVAPGAALAAVFQGAPAAPTLYRNETVQGVDVRSAGWTIGGAAFTLSVGAGGIDSAGAGDSTVQPTVALTASSTWTIGKGNTLTLVSELAGGNFGLEKGGDGTLVLAAGADSLATLTLTAGKVRLGGDGTKAIVAAALAFAASGGGPLATLDLTSNNLIIDYSGSSPLAAVRDWLRAGFNGPAGYWDGTGITSSTAAADATMMTALGVIDNSDPLVGGKTSLDGKSVDATSVLVKFTYWGDANLDGRITSDDYDVIDYFFLFPPPAANMGWWTGDFDYSGAINSSDYDRIDYAFLFQGGPLGGQGAAVPEPATLILMAAGALAAAWRRPGRP